MHGIDDKQWMAFLDGDACAEVERHLLDCTDCSEESKRFQSWQASLFEEGSRLRNGSLGDDAQVQHGSVHERELHDAACKRLL